ncbi:MAG: hypothetical protein D3910_22380 [Candidatus Electrothrix sp. ATG2]|nr:hypothetical protein [Candidatus Electrothrix sp. ATG2]
MTTTEQDRRILHTLATADPDFAAFKEKFPTAPTPAELDPEILQDTLAVLNQDPQQAATIDALRSQPTASKSFFPGTEVATLVAVAFLLRTHIKIERTANGKWRFLIEHKPADSKLLTALLQKLEQLFGGGGA